MRLKSLFFAVAILVAVVAVTLHPSLLASLPLLGAVAADQLTSRKDHRIVPRKVGAGANLFHLTLCFINAAGYTVADTGGGANRFAGIVFQDSVDNTAGIDGALTAEVIRTDRFLLTGAGFAQSDVGKTCYATDNYTVQPAAGGAAVAIGNIDEVVSATQVWVNIAGA